VAKDVDLDFSKHQRDRVCLKRGQESYLERWETLERKGTAADTVVSALGIQLDKKLEPLLRDRYSLYHIGDCDKPGNLLDAIHRAFQVAQVL
jgi:hypothetical protein